MWRTKAVRALLVEEVGALRPDPVDDESPPADRERAERLEAQIALERAIRGAGWRTLVDWLAIGVLFYFHSRSTSFLHLGPDPETVFTLAILVIAVHSGFRLGRREKLRAVARALEEVESRDPVGNGMES